MNKIELKGLDQDLYFEKLDNGLEVYLIPYKNKKNYAMHYVTKFGSISTTFVPYGEAKMFTVPDGIAHFLEHKMFEQEDGIDPFTFASKTGTYSNASTNFECTKYYFEGNKAFKENLDYLLDFVGSPYFTDSNVEKEKGIIAEEIKQYDDMIGWFLEEEIKKALLKNDNHRVDIAGTVESINKITKEDLYKTYYTFYQPSNMFIVISGDFDKDEALNIIKNNKTLNSAKTNFEIKVKEVKEPVKVYEKEKKLTFNIYNTKIGYGIKIPLGNYDKFLFNAYMSLMTSNKFGASSLFRERIKKEELMTSFHVEKELIDNYLLLSFKATTSKPNELIKAIKKELEDVSITQEELDRTRKVWIASSVMMIDNINITTENIIDDIITYGKLIDNRLDIYRSLNLKEYNKILNNIDFTNSSLVIVDPISKNKE